MQEEHEASPDNGPYACIYVGAGVLDSGRWRCRLAAISSQRYAHRPDHGFRRAPLPRALDLVRAELDVAQPGQPHRLDKQPAGSRGLLVPDAKDGGIYPG